MGSYPLDIHHTSNKIHMLSSSTTQPSCRTFNMEGPSGPCQSGKRARAALFRAGRGPERQSGKGATQMACYSLVRKDGEVELIEGADTYEQEGPLTTFFQVAPDRRVIDCWSVRLMSIRTTEIASIRRENNIAPIRREAGAASADRIEAPQRCGLEITGAVG